MSNPYDDRLGLLNSSSYTEQLAEVNSSHGVRASEDVYNVHGALVCRAGTRIDYDAARKLVRHKLTMPLDKSLEFENAVTGRGIYRRFEAALKRFSDLDAAAHNLRFNRDFEAIATKRELPKLVAQKLTVMNVKYPELMDRTVVGTWMALLMGRELGLVESELNLLFIAAVSRDLGMLHVPRDLLERPPAALYTADDWRALHSHVVASHMILQECEGLPRRVLDAVLEHHENMDGTGYPASKTKAELGKWGQILGVADTVTSLRLQAFVGSGRNLRDTRAVIQIDADARHNDVVWAAVSVLNRCKVKRTAFHAYETKAELKATLYRRSKAMMAAKQMLADMPNLMPVNNPRAHTPRLLTAFVERLAITLLRSGHGEPELAKWLQLVHEGKEEVELPDLVEIDLQQRELFWQLRRLHLQMLTFADKKNMRAQSPVRMMLERMAQMFDQLDQDRGLIEVEGSQDLLAQAASQDITHGEDFLPAQKAG